MRKALVGVVIAVLAAGCGGGSKSNNSTAKGGATTTPTVEETDTAAATTTRPVQFPCDLVPQAEIEEAVGNALGSGTVTASNVREGVVKWRTTECDWSDADSEDVDVTLGVSKPADFPSGMVECPALPGPTSRVTGIGTKAYWEVVDAGTTEKVGTLRVCAPNALVQVKLSGARDVESMQNTARGIAEKVLGAL